MKSSYRGLKSGLGFNQECLQPLPDVIQYPSTIEILDG